jgi:hypothetical protein
MKKILFLIALSVMSFAFTVDDDIDYIYSGYVVTSAGDSEVVLQFSDLAQSQTTKTLLYIQLDADNSGTIQFSAGQTITASFAAYDPGDRVPITICNGYTNLRYKASGASQSFTVTH